MRIDPTRPGDASDTEEEKDAHGWGDLRTWVFIVLMVAQVLVSGAIIYFALGSRWLTTWNLGQPPTGPNFLPHGPWRMFVP